ncbi:MAG: peptidylarginine deiminase [Marinilabiliales bacterium]|nr:MAG: peptidylarginine deiminase [Marinilabiliales bacterium]
MKAKYYIIALLMLVALQMNSQDKTPDYKKWHYLSEEEMLLPLNTARDFIETDPPTGDVRNVAEFDEMQAVIVRYPFGIPISLVKEMADDIEVITLVASASQQQVVENQYASAGVNLDNTSYLITPTDSYWVRDYGPWFVFDGDRNPGIMDFPYNRPRPNDNNVPTAIANMLGITLYGMNVYHTGGNYMTTGMGQSASTDLVYDENPQLTEQQIADKFSSYLNVNPYYLMVDPLDDYIKHIDCWAKYLSPGKVLVAEVPESDYRYDDYEAAANYFATQISSYGKPYEVHRVFAPGTYPNTPYTNSLILNNKVFVPLTGSQWDDEAIASYEDAMPGYEIVGINYDGWLNTDALHCRTKGIADLGMLYINHMPLLGNVAYQESYEINAEIYSCTGQPIYNDSVFVYYSINGGDYQQTNMTFEGNDEFAGTISGILPGDEIDYYLYAADWSGRRAKHPYIGEPDPHEFKPFGAVNQLNLTPDTLLFLNTDDMIFGKMLNIINVSNSDVTITDITEFGEFGWYVEEMPQLPYIMEIDDTLQINVMWNLPVEMLGSLQSDTMYISTPAKTYKQLLMIDSDLLSSQEENFESDITVYPNPFNENIKFRFMSTGNEDVILDIFDINGKHVFHYDGRSKQGLNTINWG